MESYKSKFTEDSSSLNKIEKILIVRLLNSWLDKEYENSQAWSNNGGSVSKKEAELIREKLIKEIA